MEGNLPYKTESSVPDPSVARCARASSPFRGAKKKGVRCAHFICAFGAYYPPALRATGDRPPEGRLLKEAFRCVAYGEFFMPRAAHPERIRASAHQRIRIFLRLITHRSSPITFFSLHKCPIFCTISVIAKEESVWNFRM